MEERTLVSPMLVCSSHDFSQIDADRETVYHNQKEIKVRPQARTAFPLFPIVSLADHIIFYTDVGPGQEHYCG